MFLFLFRMLCSTPKKKHQKKRRRGRKLYIVVPTVNGTFCLICKQQALNFHFALGHVNYVADFSFKYYVLIYVKSFGIMPGIEQVFYEHWFAFF